MKVVLFAVAFVATVAFAATIGPPHAPVAAQAAADYLPLREGAEYVYAWKFQDRTGTVTRRLKTVRIEGSTYFVFVDILEGGTESTLIAGNFPWDGPIRKTDVGIVGMFGFRIGDQLWPKEDKPDLYLAIPLKEGAKTKALATTVSIEGFEDVEVGGRTFRRCARIRQQTDGVSGAELYWLAPGVGMVKRQSSTGRLETLARYSAPKR